VVAVAPVLGLVAQVLVPAVPAAVVAVVAGDCQLRVAWAWTMEGVRSSHHQTTYPVCNPSRCTTPARTFVSCNNNINHNSREKKRDRR
jgi:hypothetical protein